ncbi:MAG: hypothetical protein HY650_11360 [Acidobacteria bacterium]|nr:hypothetical protein [Acidobacteriota bacterium]
MTQSRPFVLRRTHFAATLLLAVITTHSLISCSGAQEPSSPAPIGTSSPAAASGGTQPQAAAAPEPSTARATTPQTPTASTGSVKAAPEVITLEVAKAVMVTVEMDMKLAGAKIEDALKQVERKYEPDDGKGRTFAILDAYGETTPEGKLHLSMHLSSEKPGLGSLVFRPTGEILWQGKIIPGSTTPPETKKLTIILDDGKGHGVMLDGSNNPSSIMDTMVRDLKIPVRNYWPDGAERELTYIYSACGCPVKVMARRVGDKTVRTKDLPVIFPDDPAAANLIARLMRW